MTVTAYKVISASAGDPNRLSADVAAAITDGWQPQGGIAFADGSIYQAVVQIEPEPETEPEE